MKNLFVEFSHLWPTASHSALEPLLSKISFFSFPEDLAEMKTNSRPQKTIVILNSADIKDTISIVSMGFEHCVQKNRPDFAQELLASAFMLLKPDSFNKNPIPFFFTGFSAQQNMTTETNMTIPFRKSEDKKYILERFELFLEQNPRLRGIADLCMQVADELIMNALFSAPVDNYGVHLFQNYDRTSDIMLNMQSQAKFFSCFSDYRIIVGCEDPYGSFKKETLFKHLHGAFLNEKATVKPEKTGGAGLGLHAIIENSANFYLYCEQGQRSLVAAGFLLQGMKANLMSQKHFHLSPG